MLSSFSLAPRADRAVRRLGITQRMPAVGPAVTLPLSCSNGVTLCIVRCGHKRGIFSAVFIGKTEAGYLVKRLLSLGLGDQSLLIFITVIETRHMLNMQQHAQHKVGHSPLRGLLRLTQPATHTARAAGPWICRWQACLSLNGSTCSWVLYCWVGQDFLKPAVQ